MLPLIIVPYLREKEQSQRWRFNFPSLSAALAHSPSICTWIMWEIWLNVCMRNARPCTNTGDLSDHVMKEEQGGMFSWGGDRREQDGSIKWKVSSPLSRLHRKTIPLARRHGDMADVYQENMQRCAQLCSCVCCGSNENQPALLWIVQELCVNQNYFCNNTNVNTRMQMTFSTNPSEWRRLNVFTFTVT